MKNLNKHKLLKQLVVAIIALFAAVLLCPLFGSFSKTYAYKTLPTGESAIGNIYLGNGKFNEDNLNLLAQIVGYDSIDDMVSKVSAEPTSDTSGTNIKNSNDFGNTVVKFGSYTFNATKRELTWIPVFVSNTSQGPILTLWLANTSNVNGKVSNQEISTWSDGTYPSTLFTIIPKTYNDITVYNDTYDSSYLRNYVLKGSTNYTTDWGTGTAIIPPEASTMTKFLQFTGGGELADYLITPSNVEWQMAETYSKNDPAWKASGKYGGTDESYPSDWINDKLWLPSAFEVLCSSLKASGTTNTAMTPNGGLWQTGSNSSGSKRSNSTQTALRSAFYGDHYGCYMINADGGYGSYAASGESAVRPALHLNLSLAAENAVPNHTHNFGEWQITIPATCTQNGKRERVCLNEGCILTDGKEIEEIPADPAAHSFDTTSWTSDESSHWHDSTCGHEVTSDFGEHSWNDGEISKPPTCTENGIKTLTCTVCNKTKTESVEAAGHKLVTDEAVAPDCSHVGLTEGKHCTECDYKEPQTEIPKTEHSWGEWKTVTPATEDSNGKKERECSICHEKQTETIPALGHTHKFDNWIEEVPASCTQNGTKGHYLCACGLHFDEAHNEVTDLTIPKTEHTAGEAATCTNAQVCTVCGTQLTPASGHSWGGWITVTPATEDVDGVERRECSVCHEEETRDIPALNHTHKYENWVDEAPASCTQNGTKGHYLCTCGKYFDESHNEITDLTIPALGHTAGKAATCTNAQVCTVCGTELNPAKGHSHEWQITKKPTKEETGLKQNICTACGDIDGEEVIAKLVSDEGGNGGVIDLEPGKEYDLEILVKPTNAIYNVGGVNVGYEIALWIVVDGERDKEYDSDKYVTLMLRVPDEIAGNVFDLYKVDGIKLVPVEKYEVEGNVVTLRTTLSAEIVFHTEAAPEKSSGIPVWVWAIIAAVIAILIIIIVIIIIKKKDGNGGTPVAAAAPAATTTVIKEGTQYDDAALKAQLAAQSKKLDELMERETPAGALEKGLSDEEMRSYFTDGEIISMVNAGKLSREDGNRIISGRKK